MIELRSVSKVFPGGVTALDSVDLDVPSGQIHGIVGKSGAGKSTLIRCLTGLDPATHGEVTLGGVDLGRSRGAALRTARRSIGMVFQHANLLDSRTAAQNIAHPLEVAGVPAEKRRARVAELLDLVGLSERADNHPAQLSGGQKQRVGIARALAAEPQVLLCDEPTSALDSTTTRQILQLIRSLRDRLGITVVIITHEMSVVREVCDAVSLLQDGRIVESGSLLQVIGDTEGQLSRDLISLPPSGEEADGTVPVQVSLGEGLDVTRLFAVLASTHVSATVDAGTIETIQSAQVGRLQLSTPDAHSAQALLGALREHGFHAESGPVGSATPAHDDEGGLA